MNVLVSSPVGAAGRVTSLLVELGADVVDDPAGNDGREDMAVMDATEKEQVRLEQSRGVPVVLLFNGKGADWEQMDGMEACGFISSNWPSPTQRSYLRAILRRLSLGQAVKVS